MILTTRNADDDVVVIVAQEGTGDNLLAEDRAEGYKDYFMATAYVENESELEELESGQIMTYNLICDMTLEDQHNAILDYFGFKKADYKVA